MDRTEAQSVVRKRLPELSPLEDLPRYPAFRTVGSNLTPGTRLPQPWLVYLTVVELLEFPCYWEVWEKTLWSVPVMYQGHQILLEHGKFGLRVSAVQPDEASG